STLHAFPFRKEQWLDMRISLPITVARAAADSHRASRTPAAYRVVNAGRRKLSLLPCRIPFRTEVQRRALMIHIHQYLVKTQKNRKWGVGRLRIADCRQVPRAGASEVSGLVAPPTH